MKWYSAIFALFVGFGFVTYVHSMDQTQMFRAPPRRPGGTGGPGRYDGPRDFRGLEGYDSAGGYTGSVSSGGSGRASEISEESPPRRGRNRRESTTLNINDGQEVVKYKKKKSKFRSKCCSHFTCFCAGAISSAAFLCTRDKWVPKVKDFFDSHFPHG